MDDITYQRSSLLTSIIPFDAVSQQPAFLAIQSVTGTDSSSNVYDIMFAGRAQLIPSSTLYSSHTNVIITRNNNSLNLSINDTVDENYVAELGTYTDISNGTKHVVVDANTAYFTVNTSYFDVTF